MIDNLFISADDIGAVDSIDFAVEKLINKGIINTISVFVNGYSDVSWIKKYVNNVRVGLHLTYSFSRPVSNITDKHLLNPNGTFIMPEKPQNATIYTINNSVNAFMQNFEQADIQQLYCECQEQIKCFIDLFGIKPAFVNLHHDLDKCIKIQQMFELYYPQYKTRMMKKLNVDLDYQYFYNFLKIGKSYNELENDVAFLIQKGVHYAMNNNFSEVEVVFHPAFNSSRLQEFSTYASMREIEYNILSSDKIANLF